jgi:hypothetical protein
VPSKRPIARFGTPLVSLLLLSACGSKSDARLERLSAGISKDSVLVIMGVEKAERVDPFLIGGHYIEAMFFPLPGETDSASVQDRNMSPVIVVDGKLAGWGWKQWDSIAGANRIEVPK